MRVGLIGCCLLLAPASGGCANGGGSTDGHAPTAVPVMNESAPAPAGKLHVVFYPRVGNLEDDLWGAVGPGVVLMNGGRGPTSAFAWMHDTVDKQRIAGDVVVLCTRGGDVSSDVYAAAPFNSVQTVLVPAASPREDVALVADRLKNVEIVLLADGDAATYASWTGTPLGDAVRAVYDRGGVVAGTGAGATALGWAMLATHTDSATALANPYAPSITLAPGPFALPLMTGTFVDLGLETDERFGVLAAMTARAIADGLADTRPGAAMGVGLDVDAALAFDQQGHVTLLAGDAGASAAWIVHGGPVDRLAAGKPLVWKAAQVTRFDTVGESLELASNCGTAFSYDVAIDGAAMAPYTPTNPYEAQGTATPCTP